MDKTTFKVIISSLIILVLVSSILIYKFVLNKPKVELVLGFPNTPVYSNAELIKSAKDPREDIVWDATWETPAEIPNVAKWYLQQLQEQGWTLEVPPADINASDIQYAVLYKDNFYVLELSFIKNPSDKTEITTEFLRWVDSEKEGKFIGGEFISEEEDEEE